MSRYCSEKDIGPILSAAKDWRERCLLKGESLFGQEKIWNKKNIDALVKYFVKDSEDRKGRFLQKLEKQLEPANPSVKKLAAEMYWVMMLCPHKSKKGVRWEIARIKDIWGWSGEDFNQENPLLEESRLSGVGVGRVSTIMNPHLYLKYFVEILSRFFPLGNEKKNALMEGGWDFAEWLEKEKIPKNDTYQFRHMLLFLLFPDNFERPFRNDDRKAISDSLSQDGEAGDMSPTKIDRRLLEKRKEFEQKLETKEFDLYEQFLSSLRQNSNNQLPVPAVDKIAEEPTTYGARIPLNSIFYGPPGTGKTYGTVNRAIEILDSRYPELKTKGREALKRRFDELKSAGRIEFVTFHQSFSYEDFVEGLRASADGGGISYGVEAGVFKRICERCRTQRPDKEHVLIIDEINRGNIANIFGELITLVEESKREGALEALEVTLPYSKEKFSVPGNLYIISTMNTADRSLVHVDTALRRRFHFEEMMPNIDLLEGLDVEGIDIAEMVSAMNDRIELLFDRDHTLGHSFFLPLKDEPTLERLKNIFEHQVFPLLEEYFFEDWSRIRQVLGDDRKRDSQLSFFVEKFSPERLQELFEDAERLQDKERYKRNSDALLNPEAYRGIYRQPEEGA